MEHLQQRRYLVSFDTSLIPQVFTDVLVVGSGIAGLSAALSAARHADVLVIAKSDATDNNTCVAQGGIAAALSAEDSPRAHMEDTLAVGQGLCEPEAVRAITSEGPARVRELIALGAEFDREGASLALTREGGHSAARIAHARGDATGREVETTLLRAVQRSPRIRIVEHAFAIDLVTSDGDECGGALIHHGRHGRTVVWAKRTILATGGCGRVYRETTNPAGATGDGVAMAYRAGAELVDLEFYQFHPTALYVAGAARALISETVRGEGARLLNARGERFMPRYHEDGELAPRDAVSRAIVREIRETGHTCVYLDMRHLPAELLERRFPAIREFCAQYDIDIARDLVPVRPAAHYMIGGIRIDLDGRTSVARLHACGETASCGLHGANRLGSNSLLEGLVIGGRAGEAAGRAAAAEPGDARYIRLGVSVAAPRHGPLDVADVTNSLRAIAWRDLGIERGQFGLEEAIHMMQFWSRYVMDKEFDDAAGWELQNMLLVARLIAEAALARTESRGVHYRTDFPARDDATWLRRIVLRRGAPLAFVPVGAPGEGPADR